MRAALQSALVVILRSSQVLMEVFKTVEVLGSEGRSYRLSLVKLFGKYYIYFSLNERMRFWDLFCSVYIHKTEEPVDPLEAPYLFRDRVDMYCGKKSLYLL
jgi:hypothetical protein